MQRIVQVLIRDVHMIQIGFGTRERCGKELLDMPSML